MRPLAHQAIIPQGSGRKEHRKLFKSKRKNKKKNSTIQKNSGANEHPKKSTSNTPSPTQSLPTFFFFFLNQSEFLSFQTVSSSRPDHVTAACFVQVEEGKTAVGSFMVSWALTLWGSPIQLCKSFSKQPATLLSP